MNCKPFLVDTTLTPYIQALRCRVPDSYKSPITLSGTVSENGCTMEFLGTSYTAAESSEVYSIDNDVLYLIISKPPAGVVLQLKPTAVNPCRIDRKYEDRTTKIETTISVKSPIKCYLSADKLTIDLAVESNAFELSEKNTGFRSINGLIPDDYGNIVIRSLSPNITVTVNKENSKNELYTGKNNTSPKLYSSAIN